MTGGVWNSLYRRLAMKADDKSKNEVNNGRYKKKDKPKPKNLFEFKNNSLKGFFSYLRSHSSINDEVKVTCSSKEGGDTIKYNRFRLSFSFCQILQNCLKLALLFWN
ncbi:hypothetical protein M9Y10_003971 [Tritrichomonas musculus]|uniref:Uncharacterized protein n=1 Tax=Tritrichomonas musculus TaxID=1915356 RepID=A0ABR2JSP0_9EUKA